MSTVVSRVPSIDDIIRSEEARFVNRVPRSVALARRAERSLAGGLTSSWANTRPVPVWIERGAGSRVWDVDGNEYVDLHGGYGVNVVGHANPAVATAVRRRVGLGTHFAQPTPDIVVVAELLAERFGLPLWRFTNSGTEATMDAVHLARVVTGRELIVKVEGTYHGHHDLLHVSLWRSLDELGPRHDPSRRPGPGVPGAVADLVRIVPFNDLEAVRALFEADGHRIAGMIVEPMMMNAGIIPPEPGYLEGLRALTSAAGALLIFDEVKSGLVVGPGGATARYGVLPDLVCLAKALGGGVPCGAIGGSADVMGAIADGRYEQVGTFNGNPLTMAAARATLEEVLTPAAYERAQQLGQRMSEAAREALRRRGVPTYGYVFGFKGAVVFHDRPVRDYREFLAIDGAVSHVHYLVQHNGGVFLAPWGKTESWTLSVAHSDDDGARFVDNVDRLASQLAAVADRSSRAFPPGAVA